MSKIIHIKNDINESDDHISAKNILSYLLVKEPITLTNHLNETLIISPNDIKYIKQEFTWYIKQKKPRILFSGDIVIIDHNDNILAIIEIVKTHRISKNKYAFFQALNIFWLELSSEHVLTNNNDLYSSYTYNFTNIKHFNTNIYITDLDLNKANNTSPRQAIIENIIELNTSIQNQTHTNKIATLKQKRKSLIEQISTPYQRKIKQKKYDNNIKIKKLKAEIALLRKERRHLKNIGKSYSHINKNIKSILQHINESKIAHLSETQKNIRKTNIYNSKSSKKVRNIIIKMNSPLTVALYNILENISKQLNRRKFNISYITPHIRNKKFKKMTKQHLDKLIMLGWEYNDGYFIKI